jgi:hypothetical protein
MRAQFICLVLAVVLICPFASPQWVQTNGPFGGSIESFAISGPRLFGGSQLGIKVTTDYGSTWRAIDIGDSSASVNLLAGGPVKGSNALLFAATYSVSGGREGGIYLIDSHASPPYS